MYFSNDLAFSVEGYTLVTLNNMFTAANGVYIKVSNHVMILNDINVILLNFFAEKIRF
jgi:hypothetical protein